MSRDFVSISEFSKEQLSTVLDFLQNELLGIQIALNTDKKYRLTSLTCLDVLVDLRDVVRDELENKEKEND